MASRRPAKSEVAALIVEWHETGCKPREVFARETGRSATSVRRWLREFASHYRLDFLNLEEAQAVLAKAPEEPEPSPALLTFERELPKREIYVITSAQNATPVHAGFLAALKRYCASRDAELVVIPLRYRNPTSVWSDKDSVDDWWAPEVVPYLCDLRHMIGPNLAILADIRVQPTASNPLSGLESVSGSESCVIGHPKVAVTTVPAQSHLMPKLMVTTGSVTQANYTHTKAGKKGEFHHSIAAVVVECDGDTFYLRHLAAVGDGSFIDLDMEYTPTEVRQAEDALALVMGDVHAQFAEESVLRATFKAEDSLARMIRPRHFVWHDVLDFYAANHHHRGEPFLALAKHASGFNLVEAEVRNTFELVDICMQMFPESTHVFPRSNHDAALYRWMKEADWRSDPANAVFYLETALYLASNTRMGPNGGEVPDPFKYWGERLLTTPERCRFLSSNDSMILADVDVGSHGHEGANGARGSLKGYARLGAKSITGHSHTPGVYEGAMQVGTSSKLRMEYNKGPSSWMHTHAILYANGKRTLVHCIDGRFTTKRIGDPV